MKTAMQELIDELERVRSMTNMNFVIRIATDLLEKEKMQICNAFLEGKVNHSKDWSYEYYNQTYNQNK